MQCYLKYYFEKKLYDVQLNICYTIQRNAAVECIIKYSWMFIKVELIAIQCRQ